MGRYAGLQTVKEGVTVVKKTNSTDKRIYKTKKESEADPAADDGHETF